eukprot:9467207-Alexandrium_andersonii.AAC.1
MGRGGGQGARGAGGGETRRGTGQGGARPPTIDNQTVVRQPRGRNAFQRFLPDLRKSLETVLGALLAGERHVGGLLLVVRRGRLASRATSKTKISSTTS